ncbi:MAG: spore coat U domain-containing protein [Betaproteobacteria bacterium]
MRPCLNDLLAAGLFACSLQASAACSVEAVPVTFGRYDAIRLLPTRTTGNIAITCSGTAGEQVGYSIVLEGASGGTRTLKSGSNVLNYNLYTKADYQTIWGDGQNGTKPIGDSYFLPTSSSSRNYPVYGSMPAQQRVLAGVYTDTIHITVTF